ncbi:apolipoprotein N-acyltransferase [uncultured Alistipes sp.]|uniref:apolipoprotein N-acyltransferase n=1 Tax=uncultured Alistipes sp. TaxID=538949 RepID=UPI0025F402EB|nr:apolipoprotein N-acyltransferase [uncultured Alistipes sp.]
MFRRLAAVILSVILLSPAWLGMTGLTLPLALVPLLWISASYDASRRSWWCVFGWALLTIALWNIATIWWIWYATPIGPVAATLASSFFNMIAFMLFHTVSKKGPKALAYTLLAASWIATEYWYTIGDFSWPWLILGNGFSHDVWLVQWYEYTGVFGGSLWVILCNILFFEALRARRNIRRWIAAAAMLLFPAAVSLGIWWSWRQPDQGVARVSIIQPNVDVYDKFHGDTEWQERNIIDLMEQVPAGVQFILLPETSVPNDYWEPGLSDYRFTGERGVFWQELTDSLRSSHPGALLVAGVGTRRFYPAGSQTRTARPDHFGQGYFDRFNTSVGLDSAGRAQLHHKGKLVIGVENTPTWVFDALKFLVIDLGGVVGQLGMGQHGTAFEHAGMRMGPAICYEGLYGDFYGDFVRRGAQFMAIVSNDGWWGDTPGYTHLFSISRLRAIEHRRAVARSANTGMSGFISARGNVGQTLGWDKRGVLTADVRLDSKLTFYTRYGDYLGRISQLLMLLCVLYYIAYRVKKKNHLVK